MYPGELDADFGDTDVVTGMEKRNTSIIKTGAWMGDGLDDMTVETYHQWAEDE